MKKKIAEGGVTALIFIGIWILTFSFSWIVTCGVIKLITLCFGWVFRWSIATGIWLILLLASTVFQTTVSK